MSKQPTEFPIAAKGLLRSRLETDEAFAVFCQQSVELCQRAIVLQQALVTVALRIQQALLRGVLHAAFFVFDALQGLSFAGLLRRGNPGLALFVAELDLFPGGLIGCFRLNDVCGELRVLGRNSFFEALLHRGGPGLEFSIQPLLGRGGIADRVFESVQQFQRLTYPQVVTHSRFGLSLPVYPIDQKLRPLCPRSQTVRSRICARIPGSWRPARNVWSRTI